MSSRLTNSFHALVAMSLPLLFLLSACNQEPPTRGTITGQVYDAETKSRLGGVNLTTDPATASTTSFFGGDSAEYGSYRFSDISPGAYRIWASMPGYLDKYVDVIFAAGDTITANIHMIADPSLGFMSDHQVLYYPFTGNTHDMSGEENHGSGALAQLVYDRTGRPDSAYGFDGEEDYIISTRPISVGPEFTVLLWVYRERDGAPGTFMLEDHADKCSRGYGLALEGNGDLNILSAGCLDEVIPANVTLSARCWHLIALVVRWNYLYLYIDGFQAGPPIPAVRVPNFQLALGAVHPPGQSLQASSFKGQIDDVRVYNCVLPPDAIRALYGGYDCIP
jgi:hypothetical protein